MHNADTDEDARLKAEAKTMRWERHADCEAAQFDQSDSDGDAETGKTAVGANNCEGAGGRHIRYVGGPDGSRSGHPGVAGGPSSASGGNSRFTNGGILGCIRADAGHSCTYQELIDFHTANNIGGYGSN